MSEVFTLPSFAKINWRLTVLGRRPDGLHEIRTIFQTISLHDELTFTSRSDANLRLSCNVPEIPVDERNLVYRAAVALRQHCGLTEAGATIHIEKRIPAEGGLGGGSSNAAIALLGLASLWQVQIGEAELCALSAGLGADIPFFFTGGTALGRGLGTIITPLPEVEAEHLLIVRPAAKVATAEAYRALGARALTKVEADTILPISHADEQFAESFPEGLHNDFESVVFRLRPEIERAKRAILQAGAQKALMSGSGSTVFGIFENQEAMERATSLLESESSWRIFSCSTLSQAQYRLALGRSAPRKGERSHRSL